MYRNWSIGHCKEIRFNLELTLAISFSLWWPIGPLQHPVTQYGINYAGMQIKLWDFQNKELVPVQPNFPFF